MADSIEKLKQKNEALEKALETTTLEKESLEQELDRASATIQDQQNKLETVSTTKTGTDPVFFTFNKKRYFFPYPFITISGTDFDGKYEVAKLVRDKKLLQWLMDTKPGAARLVEPEEQPKTDSKTSKK